ncbi:MAG: ferredoxin [Cyanobacteria bacterium P01_E01_bin.42]
MRDFDTNDDPNNERSGLEPELGGIFRDAPDHTGFEPELGGTLRQKGVYVDEVTCIGCKHCVHTAPNTFYIEQDHGRARVFSQDGDVQNTIDEAMDTCPVNCIHWVDYTELRQLEAARKFQTIPVAGFPVGASAKAVENRLRREQTLNQQNKKRKNAIDE